MIWHGMGDHAGSLGLDHLAALIEDNTPEGTYVSVLATGVSGIADIISGFVGNANEQVHNFVGKFSPHMVRLMCTVYYYVQVECTAKNDFIFRCKMCVISLQATATSPKDTTQ